MKTIFISVISLFFLVLLVVGLSILKDRFGDIRPAVLPARSTPTESSMTSNGLPLILPSEYQISFFSEDSGLVRDLEFSPGGTLLGSITSTGEVIALPDRNGDGKADEIKSVLTGLINPHGIAFYNGKLYVAEETRLHKYDWDEQSLETTSDEVLFNLPAGGNHFTRSIVFDRSGKLYISLGSTCNVCNENNPWHAAIIVSDAEGNNPRLFASGLRNSVFITLNPATDEVWATDMGRDFLGDNLPPDEINIIRNGRNYGWPNCYADKTPDTNFNRNASCGNTESPIFKIQAHSSPLGLTFIKSPQFPDDWQGDLLVAYHGSWNRSTPIGYKVVRMRVQGNRIVKEEDFIKGFLEDSQATGRPVDLIFDKKGNLYISDDKAGVIYIVSKK